MSINFFIRQENHNLHENCCGKIELFSIKVTDNNIGLAQLLATMISWMNPNFFVTAYFKRSTAEFLFTERRRVKIFQQERYVNTPYEWPISEQFMEEVLPSFFMPSQTIKVEAFLQWWSVFKHNTKPTKKLIQTSWFQANFAIYLCPCLNINTAYLPYFIVKFKIKWLPASCLSTAFSDTDLI